MPSAINFVKHLYVVLLRLYPPHFRAEFAEEMQEVFLDATIEARERSVLAVLRIVAREFKDMPLSLARENWYAFTQKEGTMDRNIEVNGGLGDEGSSSPVSAPVNAPKATWWQAILAGLPHLLYPLSIEIHSLVRVLSSGTVRIYFLNDVFWVLVVVALVFGWRRKWPRWSASWVGYGLVMLFDFLINTAQTYFGSLLENEAVVLWLLITMAVFFWMAKRDWLSGLLVVLPVVPMFSTYISLDGVKGTVPEAVYFVVVGLLMMLVVMAIVRSGSLRVGVLLVLVGLRMLIR